MHKKKTMETLGENNLSQLQNEYVEAAITLVAYWKFIERLIMIRLPLIEFRTSFKQYNLWL